MRGRVCESTWWALVVALGWLAGWVGLSLWCGQELSR
jgi:hypothetical protein